MKTSALIAAALAAMISTPTLAQSAGEWTLGLGIGTVQPKSDNGTLSNGTLPVDIGSSTRPTITLEYFVMDNLGIELLGAAPFKHNINIDGLGKVGTVKHLPPVISVNYHFDGMGAFKPFVGAGVNFTGFYSTKSEGALAGEDLRVKNSWGLAASIGADYWINDRAALRANLRWIDIDADVKLNGATIGKVNIDPLVANVAYVMKF